MIILGFIGLRTASYGQVVETALALQDAGCFSVVLECVPAPVAAAATSALHIPTIGIGAGPLCSGQVRLSLVPKWRFQCLLCRLARKFFFSW